MIIVDGHRGLFTESGSVAHKGTMQYESRIDWYRLRCRGWRLWAETSRAYWLGNKVEVVLRGSRSFLVDTFMTCDVAQ